MLDLILEPSQILIPADLIIKAIQVEYIVPQEMMAIVDMLLQGDQVPLEMRPADPAYKAVVLLVHEDGLALVPERREGVDHDAADDVAEQHLHENHVEQVEAEPENLELCLVVVYLL
jgi:hypothetical protein